MYLGLRYPDIFGRLAVMSPSVWWNQRSILGFVAEARPKPNPRIWLDIGTAEGMRHVRDTELLQRRLIQQGWKPGVDLELMEVEGGACTTKTPGPTASTAYSASSSRPDQASSKYTFHPNPLAGVHFDFVLRPRLV